MDKIIICEKPTCTTCRKMIKMLNELGIEHNKVNYFIEPFKIKGFNKKNGY